MASPPLVSQQLKKGTKSANASPSPPKKLTISSSTPNLKSPEFDKIVNKQFLSNGINDINYTVKNLQREMSELKEMVNISKEDLQYVIVKSVKTAMDLILQARTSQDAQLNAELHIIKAKLAECSKTMIKGQGVTSGKTSVAIQTGLPMEGTLLTPSKQGPKPFINNSLIPPNLQKKLLEKSVALSQHSGKFSSKKDKTKAKSFREKSATSLSRVDIVLSDVNGDEIAKLNR